MNEKATNFKERTIQALQSSNRPMTHSDLSPTEPVRQNFDKIMPRKSHSPLRNKSNGGKSVPDHALPSYHVRDELKYSGQKNAAQTIQPTYSPARTSGSPLRQKHQALYGRETNSALDYCPVDNCNNDAYIRMRKSVDRISRVLGLQNPLDGGLDVLA